MRVLLVTRAGIGGAARHVLDVVRGLSPRHDLTVLASPRENRRYPEALARAGARVVRVPLTRGTDPLGDLRALAALRAEIAKAAPDLIHAHAAKPGLVARLGAERIPVVYSPHGFYHHYPTAPPALRKAAFLVERALAPRTAVLALCARWEREAAKREGLAGRCETVVVPNGVPLPPPPPEGERRAVRAELGVRAKERLVIMASRLKPPKDPLTFLAAAAKLGPGYRLVLTGEGPDLARCRAAAPGNAIVTGFRQDLPRILDAADLAVLCTRFEAAPYFLIEAMAAGLPTVATDLPATRDALGPAGVLVPPGDAASLATAIERTLENREQAKNLGAEARRRVAERASIEAMLAATERAWRRGSAQE